MLESEATVLDTMRPLCARIGWPCGPPDQADRPGKSDVSRHSLAHGLTKHGFIIAFVAVVCRRGKIMVMDGLITLKSSYGPEHTMNRLEAQVRSKGMTVFAHIDHAAGAAGAGLPLRPTDLLIFGDARGGTPLLQANQTIGIDLPLKVLVWQDNWHHLARLQRSELDRPAARPGAGGNADNSNHNCAAECTGDGGNHMSLVKSDPWVKADNNLLYARGILRWSMPRVRSANAALQSGRPFRTLR